MRKERLKLLNSNKLDLFPGKGINGEYKGKTGNKVYSPLFPDYSPMENKYNCNIINKLYIYSPILEVLKGVFTVD